MIMKKLFLALFMMATVLGMSAKDITVKGVVVSGSDNETLPGVSVMVKGTAKGVATDLDGNFSLTAPENSVISFSYVGFTTQQITAKGDMSDLHIVLKEERRTLDDLVVIGYGTQKKSVVTASIAKVSSDDLNKVNPVRVDDALKGLAAGINVTSNNGQPGAGSTIRIRGIGTINASDPLYIVDGMPAEDGIAFLNPNDIASIEVLKDAASGAVYGARAANGVILITTKAGKAGKVHVSYDVAYSMQNPWRKRKLLNATEYAIMMNEGSVNNGGDILYADPYSYGKGTDWQDEVFDSNAPQWNHQVTISGASEKVEYYLSVNYFLQKGIIGGSWDRSKYERTSVRSNTTYHLFDLTKQRDWLNKMNLTSNITYTHVKTKAVSTNSEFGSILGSAVMLSPILGVYYPTTEAEAAARAEYAGNANFTPVEDASGRLYTLPGKNYNELANPVAMLSLPGETGWNDKIFANWSAEVYLWKNLRFKSSFGLEQNWQGNDGWTPKYYLNDSGKFSKKSQVWSSMWRSTYWQTENVFSWDQKFGDHSVAVVLGQSAEKNTGRTVGGARYNMLVENEAKANIDACTGLQTDGLMSVYGGAWEPHTLTSLFGRVSYNFAERYMFQATVRRDGSSNFGSNNRYGTFPSLSVGWNITNESFMQKRPDWLSNAKLRFSWGKNGNENIGRFRFITLTATGSNYAYGSGAAQAAISGVKPGGIANKDLKWEESQQTDVGLDLGFFRNSLTFTADYFYKYTKGMLMDMPIPGYVGEISPIGNVGTMENKGVEFELGYNYKVSDWNFHFGANASYVKNKLLNLGNSSGFMTVESCQGISEIVRATNGMTFPYFYGYKSNGIFQDWNEINAYVNSAGELIQPKAVPGDVRWVDVNGDGTITNADETKIGKGMPDWVYGLNFNVTWKNWDFSMMCQGTIGNDVYDASRRTDITSANLPLWMLDRWTGYGTSNKYPRFSSNDQVNWGVSSDLYVSDGDYFRVKNMQLGYTLPASLTQKFMVTSLRLYVAAENLLTFTKYAGFDPEVTNGSSQGVDRGVYPQSRVFTFGLNLNF
jgi:TonB-linked SusC/RagA family outer membrane protein